MLDPFGKRAESLIREEFGDLMAFLERIPSSVSIDEPIALVSWLLESENPPQELIKVEGLEELRDLFRFYALLGAASISPYGLEAEIVKRTALRLYSERIKASKSLDETMLTVMPMEENEIPHTDLNILERRMDRHISPEERERLEIKYKMPLKDFLNLWTDSLKEVYIRNGYAYLRWETALRMWERVFEKRFERAVNILYDHRDELPEFYYRLREKLEEIAEKYFKERGGMFKGTVSPLRFDLFPPCVKEALKGVPAGMRNYAITVLLTSFLSYARICPNPPKKDVRVKDCINDLRILEEEILPVIIEAGNRCKPPLFEDQPHEIKNIWYHLGFGLTDSPTMEDSGNSTWYFPPNCDKIRANAPSLCKPDKYCRGIKNPLSYYLKRLYLEGKKKEGETSE
ncbi:DNA primase large subunit PriL [Thermococcus stetteri]|uniref:DNA primase large subunit PriL n=1 Tax=Thermococcus stetteri TaxID=49900 RepID=UPI001AE41970|nr:DNA primase large subunit PriL [Thermococcus stetteri]MBP1911598.1 DNA primase large subunit [Thermococcus stetteri]